MTTTPQVPFDAELLAEIEALLPRGETIMGFVETLPARLSSTEESRLMGASSYNSLVVIRPSEVMLKLRFNFLTTSCISVQDFKIWISFSMFLLSLTMPKSSNIFSSLIPDEPCLLSLINKVSSALYSGIV